MVTLIAKEIFHQPGVSPSITPAILSESQPGPCWLPTSGSRSSEAVGACTLISERSSKTGCAAIRALLSRKVPFRFQGRKTARC